LLALELLKHEGGAADAAICERLRTGVAVMYACGLDEVRLAVRLFLLGVLDALVHVTL